MKMIKIKENIFVYDTRWQYPARTEQHAFEACWERLPSSDEMAYVAFPWASYIDHIQTKSPGAGDFESMLDDLLARIPARFRKGRLVTVSQHIKTHEYASIFTRAGVTNIFWPHAEFSRSLTDGVTFHPFPLFPVQTAHIQKVETIPGNRELLFSFAGAYDPRYYRTRSREWIAALPKVTSRYRAHLRLQKEWHFQRIVYERQVKNLEIEAEFQQRQSEREEEYKQIVSNSLFSLCPSGSGPNSIRLWESLGLGAIPVILADGLKLPGSDDLWRQAAVFVRETEDAIKGLPDLLMEIREDASLLQRKRAACAELYKLYGPGGFISDVIQFFREFPAGSSSFQRYGLKARPMALILPHPPAHDEINDESGPASTAKLAAALPAPETVPGSTAMPAAISPATPASKLVPAQRLVISMQGPITGDGWYDPERDGQGSFRWSGPSERATLTMPIQRDREMMLVAAYHFTLTPDQLDGLRIEVDGAVVPHSIHAELKPKCITARLPAGSKQSGKPTEVAFVVRTVSPSSLQGGSKDTRPLGLAVFWVAAVPVTPALPIPPMSRFESIRRRIGLSRAPSSSSEELPLSYFDGLAYMEAYPDVAEAVLDGRMASALEHYRSYGSKDGQRFALAVARPPNAGVVAEIFDGLAYLESYPDVAEIVCSEIEPSALDHFIKYGRHDRRPVRVRLDGMARRGTAIDLACLDAAREARAHIELVKSQLIKDLAARERDLYFQLDGLRAGSAEILKQLSAAARVKDLARLWQAAEQRLEQMDAQLAAAQAREKLLNDKVGALESQSAEMQRQISAAEEADGAARQQHVALQNQVQAEVVTMNAWQKALLSQIDSIRSSFVEARQTLAKQVDAVTSGLARTQEELQATARTEDLARLQQEAQQRLAQLNAQLAAAQARENALNDKVGALESRSAEMQHALQNQVQAEVVAARTWQKALLSQIDSIKSSFVQAQQTLATQVDAVTSGLASVQAQMQTAARTDNLERLKQDATRELERVRGEIANALTMREAREQAVVEQIELLRISLDDAQRKLSGAARADELDNLKRDAARDIERVRGEIASMSTVEGARVQALLAQIDTLKAEINAAKSRAELAEVKVASAQRELDMEARNIGESVKNSSAALERLRNEMTGQNSKRDSTETVIKTELDLLKHELSIAQMADLVSSASKGGKGKSTGKSLSQLGQDLWVLQKTQFKKGGYFVDIGATDGVLLSNTYLLEKHYNWKGICVEPDPAAFEKLSKNRQSLNSNACLWSSSGQELDFILAKEYGGVLSTASLDGHASKRSAYKNIGQVIKVRTTSLNDLLEDAKAPKFIDYISLDTEGSEYEILRTFDFKRWKVRMWTIEHNHTDQRQRIYELMTANGYKRREVEWDDWYYL